LEIVSDSGGYNCGVDEYGMYNLWSRYYLWDMSGCRTVGQQHHHSQVLQCQD
jgi:hypothetical protein